MLSEVENSLHSCSFPESVELSNLKGGGHGHFQNAFFGINSSFKEF